MSSFTKVKEYINNNKNKFFHDVYPNKYEENKNLKIIGITGSYGKTTTLKIVHEYLKKLGKKSVLFASCGIDLPISSINPSDEVEVALYNEKSVFNALYGAYMYGADYLLLEVNESVIAKGLVKDVPFDIKALTNIVPLHNTFEYTEEEYVNIKKKFFSETLVSKESICIYGEVDKKYLDDLLIINDLPKKIATSRYIASVKGLDEKDVDYLLYPNNKIMDSLSGLNFNIKTRSNVYNINSNLIMPYNALNINLALAIIDSLGELRIELFNEILNSIIIPGRDEVIKDKGRTIIISITCAPHLEILKKYKERGEINNIILVTGSYGSGFVTWSEEYNSNKYSEYVNSSMKFIYKYINRHVDKVYITSVDNASSDALELINNQIKELDSKIIYKGIIDRRDAIKEAISDSKPGNVIFISGRGNRAIFCKSYKEVEYYKDIDVVKEAIEKLKE